MRKIAYSILFIITLLACNNRPQAGSSISSSDETANPDQYNRDSYNDDSLQSDTNQVEILYPTRYRIVENDDPTKKLNNKWAELYLDNESYFIQDADFSLANGVDECTGLKTKEITTNRETLLFINHPGLKKGLVNNIKINRNHIWPNEHFTFKFDSISYTIRAEGIIADSENTQNEEDSLNIWHTVTDYKLFLQTDNETEDLLFDIKSFNGTFIELLFIGDLDRDNKPDFIFNNSQDYEETRISLFLSSMAEEGSFTKKVSEVDIQFDC